MNKFLSTKSLDFALAHIRHYYDTDFFPRTEEFLAIAYHWEEVKKHLLEADMDGILSAAPLAEAWPKVRGGYRVVHRLEPLDALIYTAFAKVVLPNVEKSRSSPEVACSYRLVDGHDSFFGDGSGFDVFRDRCAALASEYQFVLCTDISDFYNKIYLHRLQNALQLATDTPQGISKRIEYFLTALNTKASQGIPVGPAASIVMSEVTLNDVDKFIYDKGLDHVRYVDDVRIFANTKERLEGVLQSLTLYLYENQRLSLNPEKTYILPAASFAEKELNNQYTQEKLHILDELDEVNPYAMEFVDELEKLKEVPATAAEVLLKSLDKLLGYTILDLGLARAIIRRAKAFRVDDILVPLLERIEFLSPVVNDVVLYLDALSSPEFLKKHATKLADVCDSPATNIRAVRLWFEWYFSRHTELLGIAKVRSFVFASDRLRPQAQAAISLKSEAWIKDRKTKLLHYAYWDRRSIILAASLLAKDERDKWLGPLIKGDSLSLLEKWMARWVLEGSPIVDPFELPF
jgi:hypothetical protein